MIEERKDGELSTFYGKLPKLSLPSSAEEETALELLYDYYIKEKFEDPISFGKWEKISLILEILGGSGGIYSWPPAKQYGEGKPLWLSYSLQITNPLSNVLFLINATDNLLDSVVLN